MDISKIECIAMIGWMPESELPEWVDNEVYRALFPSSKGELGSGLNMFPYIKLCNKVIFLINEP